MKRFLRITFAALLLLAGAGMLTWYFIMRRLVPSHASCIPKDAIAVLTLNVRELALDHSSDEHLFPIPETKRLPKEVQSLLKSVEQNDGSGLQKTADVLAFFYRDGDAAFFGLSVAMNDTSKFRSLLLDQLSKKYSLGKIPGTSLVQVDTSSAVIGWNESMALVIYPFSNHDAAESARQCAKLLSQQESASVLTNENFREHELASFDAGIWLQADPLLAFTNGGSFFRTALHNISHLSLNIDFRDGEIAVKKLVTCRNNIPSTAFDQPLFFTSEPKDVSGFWRLSPDLRDTSMLKYYSAVAPLKFLPFSDEEMQQIVPLMDGNVSMLWHDTLSYEMNFITYEYDEEFNQVPVTQKKKETMLATSFCYGLKDAGRAKKLISAWMAADSIPMQDSTWQLNQTGEPLKLIIRDGVLTLSSWPACDGKKRFAPAGLQPYSLHIAAGQNLHKAENDILEFLAASAGMNNLISVLADNVGMMTASLPARKENTESSNIRIAMQNGELNSLIQLEDILRKALEK
jgi:hypothetical protein